MEVFNAALLSVLIMFALQLKRLLLPSGGGPSKRRGTQRQRLSWTSMKIPFADLRPFNPKTVLRDVFAGLTLASVNVPQSAGYTRFGHARGYRTLHGAAANLCVRGLRFLAPSCRGRQFPRPPLYFPGHCRAWRRPPAPNMWPLSVWSRYLPPGLCFWRGSSN